jgi:hypothetical protein
MMAIERVVSPAVFRETDITVSRVKRYLQEWAEFERGASCNGDSAPDEVPYLDYMVPSVDGGRLDDDEGYAPNPYVRKLVDAAIDDLTPSMPLARAVLAVRYMNARGPSVYRSGRLLTVPPAELDNMADTAELRLIPICRRRGLFL